MEWISQVWSAFMERIPTTLGIRDAVDILLITVLVYQLLKLTRKTRAFDVLKGIFALFVVFRLVEIFQFKTLSWVLEYIIGAGAVVLVVLFQPEIRRVLEQMGLNVTKGIEREHTSKEETDKRAVVQSLVQTMVNLSRRNVGALIVLKQRHTLDDVVETGAPIDAIVSSRLLENIFEPKTPLHDGAVVVDNDRVVAAACLLPMSGNKDLPDELGTRHRSAVGMSERSDAVVLVVSEETGTMSVTRDGVIRRPMTAEGLTELLNSLYGITDEGKGKGRSALKEIKGLLKKGGLKK